MGRKEMEKVLSFGFQGIEKERETGFKELGSGVRRGEGAFSKKKKEKIILGGEKREEREEKEKSSQEAHIS